MLESMPKTNRAIARETLRNLFGNEYFQTHSERLLERLADETGDHTILKSDPLGDMLDGLNF